jgi:hypothetical protein
MKIIKIAVLAIIMSIFPSCEEIISVPDISEELVIIQSPVNGAEIDTSNIRFSWMSVDFAEVYEIQVATPSFTEAYSIVVDTIVGDSLNTVSNFESNFEPQSYEWRIRASNAAFQTSYTTSSFSITSEFSFADLTVDIITPENEFVTSDTIVNIDWEAAEGALLYRIIVENTVTNEVLIEVTTQETSLEIDFMTLGSYEYKVRAETDVESTLYTSQIITIE